ncbi:MAG: kynureninase [Acidimicrobiales bacterium]
MAATRTEAEALDATDPLRWLRDEFVIANDGLIYLDGNSLGRLPRRTERRLSSVVTEGWGSGLVSSWDSWVKDPTDVGDRLGAALLGVSGGQTVVGDSTTINLFKLAHAALDAARGQGVVTDRGNFPTDRYVLAAVARARGADLRVVDDPSIYEPRESDGLVSFSAVDYRTGALLDMNDITERAHRVGALALWDLSHAVGVVPLDLDALGVDMAVGCTYKYLNAGPGAPAFAYVRHDLQAAIDPVIPGWFGHADRFAMGPDYVPGPGVARLLTGTPDVLGLAAVDEGLRLLSEAGLGALRRKSLALTDLVMAMVDVIGPEFGLDVVTPRQPEHRGAHVSVRHPQAWEICQALRARNVVPDFREPDLLRMCPAPAYTRFVDAWDGVRVLGEVVSSGAHRSFPTDRRPVT